MSGIYSLIPILRISILSYILIYTQNLVAQAWDKGNITSSHKPSHPSSRITSGSHGDGSHGHGMVKKKKKNTLRSERSEGKLSRQMTSVTPAIVSDDDLDISIRSGIHHTHTHTHTMSCIMLFTTT